MKKQNWRVASVFLSTILIISNTTSLGVHAQTNNEIEPEYSLSDNISEDGDMDYNQNEDIESGGLDKYLYAHGTANYSKISVHGSGCSICPSAGEVHPLIVMVDFNSTPFNEGINKSYVQDLFFGTEDTTSAKYPVESLSAWYERSSYGKLIFTGGDEDIMEIHMDNTREYYTDDESSDGEKEMELIQEIMDQVNTYIGDSNRYDSDGNGKTDALCVIYAGEAGEWATQWWSSCKVWDSSAYTVCMESHLNNAGTAIHEFGHILGLPDLYDTHPESGGIDTWIATSDMMGNTTSDFDAFCKLLLGWIDEDNVKMVNYGEDNQKVTLSGYASTGDCALLYLGDSDSSIFGEYYLVEYTDLKQNDKELDHFDGKTYLRIFHVNSFLDETGESFLYDNVYEDDISLIRAVDKDGHLLHGTSTNTLYPGSIYRAVAEEDYNCAYFEGDEFTPYSAPSSTKYSSSASALEPGVFSGLSITGINISDNKESVTFTVSYDASPKDDVEPLTFVPAGEYSEADADLSKTAVDSPKFYLRGNHDFHISDDGLKAYIRKKGHDEALFELEVQQKYTFGSRNYIRAPYVLNVTCSGTLEGNTDYELVFPAGMFVTSYGSSSGEIIVDGIHTMQGDVWEGTAVFEKEGYGGFCASNMSCVAIQGESNTIIVPANKVGVGIVACTLDGKTGELVKETILVEDPAVSADDSKNYYISSFSRMDNGKYVLLTYGKSDEIFIFDSDLHLLKSVKGMEGWKLYWPDYICQNGNKICFWGGIIDTDTMTVTDNKTYLRPNDGEYDYWDMVIPIDCGYICQQTGLDPVLLNEELVEQKRLWQLSGIELLFMKESKDGYLAFGQKEGDIIKIEMDSEFQVISYMTVIEDAYFDNVYCMKNGYALTWSGQNAPKGRTTVYDRNFHKQYDMECFLGFVNRDGSEECLCGITETGMLYWGTSRLDIKYSTPITIDTTEHQYVESIQNKAITGEENSKDGGVFEICSLCGEEKCSEIIPYANELIVKSLMIVDGDYQFETEVLDHEGEKIPSTSYEVYVEKLNTGTYILKATLSGNYTGELEYLFRAGGTVELSKDKLILKIGECEQLSATAITSKGERHNFVIWGSENEDVAIVDETGNITAVKEGTTIITVTTEDRNYTVICEVEVMEESSVTMDVESVILNKSELELAVDESEMLVATVNPENATNKTVTWSSVDETVATVDANGKVTALSPGVTIITVTTEDGEFTAKCEVTVKIEFIPDPHEQVVSFVDRIYTVWLERSSDSDGAADWTKKLEDKSWSGAQVAEFFVFSKESMDKNRSNEDFIDVLYKLLMNRDPAEDPSGYAYWKEQMQNGMSKYQLVASFIASPEYTQICTDYGIERGSVDMDTVNQVQGFVGRFYTLAMERDADQSGVDYWTAGLRRSEFNGASIAANFFFSDEMNAKHISDEKYIELLYQVMMGRPSDEGGKAYWLGNMADGMTKEQVLNGFITSPEFTGICADYGIERGSL